MNKQLNEQLDSFSEDLKITLGDNLKSIVLYGSAVTDHQTKHYSDVNVLVIAEKFSAPILQQINTALKKWKKAGHTLPLFMTVETLQGSTDVFPLEYLDMKARHQVIYGIDLLDSIAVDNKNLRHQVEYELRSKTIQLRQKYLEVEGRPKEVKHLLAKALSTFTALFKGILWLAGETPPMGREEIWAALDRLVSFDKEAFEKLLHHREGRKEAASYDANELFDRFHTTLNDLIAWVDQFDANKNGGRL